MGRGVRQGAAVAEGNGFVAVEDIQDDGVSKAEAACMERTGRDMEDSEGKRKDMQRIDSRLRKDVSCGESAPSTAVARHSRHGASNTCRSKIASKLAD